jgi:hypothetical protein
MSQTPASTYGFALDKAQAGQKVDLSTDIVDSYAAQTAIAFGRGVSQGTAANQVNLAAAGGAFIGVALFTHAKEQALAGGAAYAIGDVVSTLAFGRVWGEAVGAVTKEADAYVITTVGANQGKFTASSGSGALGPVGRFKSAGENELVIVEITAALRGATGPQGEPGE